MATTQEAKLDKRIEREAKHLPDAINYTGRWEEIAETIRATVNAMEWETDGYLPELAQRRVREALKVRNDAAKAAA